jgi:beta-glucosidase
MRISSALLLLSALTIYGCSNSTEQKVDSAKLSIVDSLLSQMTIKEKVGQMTQLNLDVVGEGGIYTLEEPHRLNEAKLRKAILDYSVGSILNCGGHAYPREQWHELIGRSTWYSNFIRY